MNGNKNESAISSFSLFLRPDPERREIYHYKPNFLCLTNQKLNNQGSSPEDENLIDHRKDYHNVDQKTSREVNTNFEVLDRDANHQNNLNPNNQLSNIANDNLKQNKIHLLNLKNHLVFLKEAPIFISITIKNDSEQEISKLNGTLKSIEENLPDLKLIGITPQKILLFLFIENIFDNKNIHYLLPGLSQDQISLEEESQRGLYSVNNLFYDFKSDDKIKDCMNIICVFKKGMDVTEAQKVFFLGFCKELTEIETNESQKILANNKEGNPIENSEKVSFGLLLLNGVKLSNLSIRKMIMGLTYSTTTFEENTNFAAVGNIRPECSGGFNSFQNLYSLTQEFEYTLNSAYDQSQKSLSSRNSTDNRFSMIKINKKTLQLISNYYLDNKSENDINRISFHNEYFPHSIIYSLSSSETQTVIYLPDCGACIDNTGISFEDMMQDTTDRNRSSLQMFIHLFFSTFSFKNCTFKKVIFSLLNFVELFSLVFYFFLPGLFNFVIYSIFFEAFGPQGQRATNFFTVIYTFFILVTSLYSLVTDKTNKLKGFFHVLHYIFFIMYLFIFFCSIAAVHFIRTKKDILDLRNYTFNAGAFAALIVINFVFGVTPMILNFSFFKSKILAAGCYLLGGATSNSSLFVVFSIFNTYNIRKGAPNKEIKSAIFLTIFLIAYLVFGYFIFFLDTRTDRVRSVLGLSVIFTIYYGIRNSLIIFSFVRYYCSIKKKFNSELVGRLQTLFSNNQIKSKVKSDIQEETEKNNPNPNKIENKYQDNNSSEKGIKSNDQVSLSNNMKPENINEKKNDGNNQDQLNNTPVANQNINSSLNMNKSVEKSGIKTPPKIEGKNLTTPSMKHQNYKEIENKVELGNQKIRSDQESNKHLPISQKENDNMIEVDDHIIIIGDDDSKENH
jgi:hypothetical protein